MMKRKSFRKHPRLLAVVFAAGLSGCWAGYPAPKETAQLSYGSSIVKMGAARWDLPASDLDSVVGTADAGKIIERSLRAHGGWDRWRELTSVAFRRTRVWYREAVGSEAEPAAAPGEAHNAVEESDERSISFDPRNWGGAEDADASLFSLPFLLLRGGYTQEYLGAQIDISQDREFDKVRFVGSPQDGRSTLAEEFVIYFDSFSGLVTQVLLHQRPGEWLLVRLSGWETVAGLRLATRRKAYRLERMFQRTRPELLRWSDTLVDIDLR